MYQRAFTLFASAVLRLKLSYKALYINKAENASGRSPLYILTQKKLDNPQGVKSRGRRLSGLAKLKSYGLSTGGNGRCRDGRG